MVLDNWETNRNGSGHQKKNRQNRSAWQSCSAEQTILTFKRTGMVLGQQKKNRHGSGQQETNRYGSWTIEKEQAWFWTIEKTCMVMINNIKTRHGSGQQ